jgi:phospholipid/cholesterol/gamma-HCH transport system permease protein
VAVTVHQGETADAGPVPQEAPLPRKPNVVVEAVQEAGSLIRFSGGVVLALPRSLRYFSEILRQAAIVGPSTLLLLAFMEIMIGISSANFVYFLLKALGAGDFTGVGGGVLPRVSCVVMFGYVFVTKVCGGFVAELGTMKINQEIAALDSTGVDPMAYVVGTRVLATILLIPISAGVALVTFYLGYYFTSVIVLHGVTASGLNQFYWGAQSFRDVEYTVIVITLTTVATALAACFYGMRASGGPAGVGSAVARAVLVNLLIVHILGMLMVTLWYGNSFGLPIGG